jgi:hypothetical protein
MADREIFIDLASDLRIRYRRSNPPPPIDYAITLEVWGTLIGRRSVSGTTPMTRRSITNTPTGGTEARSPPSCAVTPP